MADILNSNCDRRVLSDRWIEGKNIIARFRDIKDYNTVTRPTSRFVQDYNYLNMSSLSVGYEFKRDMIRKPGPLPPQAAVQLPRPVHRQLDPGRARSLVALCTGVHPLRQCIFLKPQRL